MPAPPYNLEHISLKFDLVSIGQVCTDDGMLELFACQTSIFSRFVQQIAGDGRFKQL